MIARPVILDCDPGHDDAIAMLMAFAARDQLDVLAITVVAGNQLLEKTVNNALRILSFAGLECEVAAGYSRPLLRPLKIAPEVHGDSGLDGPILPDPAFAASQRHAVEVIIDKVRTSKQQVTLIPTGPLTNIAAALIGAPDIWENIERIVLMGGAADRGNWTPAAEFNILVDPEAARFVFQSGIPITMVGLDATHQALVYEKDIAKLKQSGQRVAIMVGELLDFFAKFHHEMGFAGSPLHDPLAVAAVLDPTVITTKRLPVTIETQGEFTTGRTVVDFYRVTDQVPNVDVALDVDRDKFVDLLFRTILSYK